MSFPPHNRHRYTRSQIKCTLPRQRGVYAIFNEEQWLYVGHTDDIRASLLDHWENDDRLDALCPSGWTYEVTDVPNVRAALLVSELRPVLNLRARAQSRLLSRPSRTMATLLHLTPPRRPMQLAGAAQGW